MKLLTKAIEKRFAKLGRQDNPDGSSIIVVKFFHPFSTWRWFATEYCPKDRMFFGMVDGFEKELGSFSLAELQEVRIKGLPIERDMHYGEKTLAEQFPEMY